MDNKYGLTGAEKEIIQDKFCKVNTYDIKKGTIGEKSFFDHIDKLLNERAELILNQK